MNLPPLAQAHESAHRLDVLVADEASVHLRADDGELAVEVISRLSVRVGHLEKADYAMNDGGREE